MPSLVWLPSLSQSPDPAALVALGLSSATQPAPEGWLQAGPVHASFSCSCSLSYSMACCGCSWFKHASCYLAHLSSPTSRNLGAESSHGRTGPRVMSCREPQQWLWAPFPSTAPSTAHLLPLPCPQCPRAPSYYVLAPPWGRLLTEVEVRGGGPQVLQTAPLQLLVLEAVGLVMSGEGPPPPSHTHKAFLQLG